MDTRFAFLSSAKTAMITAFGTMLTGFGMILDWMPAKAPAAVGMLLSIVLIYVNWRRGRVEHTKALLEIEHMKAEEARQKRRFNERQFYRKEGDQSGVGPFLPAEAKDPG
jgi:hypothetical protein